MNFQPPDPVCAKCGAETPPCDCDYEGNKMTQAERGLFETITSYMNLDIRHRNTMRLKEICAEFELAYGGIKNALEHERKCHHAAQDRIAEFEAPHPVFQICEERDAFMFKCRELNGRLAEAERERDLSRGLLKNAEGCNERYAARNRQLHEFIKSAGLTAPLPEKKI